jgi:hypothetical protein
MTADFVFPQEEKYWIKTDEKGTERAKMPLHLHAGINLIQLTQQNIFSRILGALFP